MDAQERPTSPFLDGVYIDCPGGSLRFRRAKAPTGAELEGSPMEQLPGSSIPYRIAVGPQQGLKVFTLPPEVQSRSQ